MDGANDSGANNNEDGASNTTKLPLLTWDQAAELALITHALKVAHVGSFDQEQWQAIANNMGGPFVGNWKAIQYVFNYLWCSVHSNNS